MPMKGSLDKLVGWNALNVSSQIVHRTWHGCGLAMIFFGAPCLLLLAEGRGFSKPLPPDKLVNGG